MEYNEPLCSVALTLCPGIKPIVAKRLVECVGSAADVFRRRGELPRLVPDIGKPLLAALDAPDIFARAEAELAFAEKHRITCLTLHDTAYPARMRECEDAPLALFFKGEADLNRKHVVSVVGTRRASEYGKQFCESFLRDLAALVPDVLVVSGLAYGIDVQAHRAAMRNGLPTVAVLGHGLDRIYPPAHRRTAVEMLEGGGLVTEFHSGTSPMRYHFVSRNRIIAGMADATVVVESAAKGGSLITAELAMGYHRDCFAVPGRVTDGASVGCNQLLRDNKAALIQHAEDFAKAMGWVEDGAAVEKAAPRLPFVELSEEETRVVQILSRYDSLQINALVVESDIPVHRLSALLFELEMKGMVKAMVGGAYRVIK
ncbi:MAG: DNA-processing protein DprA [Prevotellaceae bacterium]|nr:DNA-processing protein DprA [Prevotellaceae bacterium]